MNGSVKRLAVAIIALWALQTALLADPASDIERWEHFLKNTPAAELPASVAKTLQQADSAKLLATTTNLVKLAVRINPAATVPIVSAASAAEPQLAGIIAEVAVGEQNQLAAEIARAAALASPRQAGEIVKRAGHLAPAGLRSIAVEVSRVVPSQNRETIRAAGMVRPELNSYLQSEMARYGQDTPSVARCFDRAEQAWVREDGSASGGRTGPVLATAPQSKPGKGGGNPPGGRNYARP